MTAGPVGGAAKMDECDMCDCGHIRAEHSGWCSAESGTCGCNRFSGAAETQPVEMTTVELYLLLNRVRALHSRYEQDGYVDVDCGEGGLGCDHDGDCPTCILVVCAHCWSIAEAASLDFWENVVPSELMWPCATIRAVSEPA